MLNCVYHAKDDMRVVEDDEKEKLIASGEWFDHPNLAKAAQSKPIEKKVKPKKEIEQ